MMKDIQIVKKQHFLWLLNNLFNLMIFLAAALYFLIKLLSHDISLSSRFLYFQIPALIVILAVAAGYLVCIVGTFFSTKIVASRNSIIVKSSFINRKETALAYTNAHMFISGQNILQRLFNVKRLRLSSGSRSLGAEIDITTDAHTVTMIENAIKAIHCAQDKPQADMTVNGKWIALYSLLIPSKWLRPVGFTLSIVIIIIGLLRRAPALPLVGLYALAVAISIGGNALSALIKYDNFCIKDYDCALSISYGKLDKYSHFILKDRINGVIVNRHPLNALTKTCTAYLLVAGCKDTLENFSLPFLPIADADRLQVALKRFLPQLHTSKKKHTPPTRAKKTYFFRLLLPAAALLPPTIYFSFVGLYLAMPAYLLIIATVAADIFLSYRRSHFYCDSKVFCCAKGGLFSKSILCKTDSVQALRTTYSVFNEKKRIAKCRLFIRSLQRPFRLPYFDKEAFGDKFINN